MHKFIGFYDKNNMQICNGDTVQTFDKKGRKWIGVVIPEDPSKIIKSTVVENGGIQYVFKPPFSYGTWINDQKYASTLEIVERVTFTNSLTQMLRGVL